ncbi:hypothetical protein [Streptomyces atratus]|uniref:hypothetical protein n=1 Tax=Streptomyces atratus TaxID=1893 RepID=UPI0021A355D6|nr:hypothetical protein [Streptomyces atratus]MCT2546234.1 hypothetical protein [Streptomyces atratus]
MTEVASAVPAYVLLAALAVIVVLLTVVAIVARSVVAKARPEDLQHILPGLGQVLAALALWIQRIVRFPHVQSTVLALVAQPAYAVVSPASDPLGAAIDAVVHTGMDSVADIADDLDHAWATRPPDQSVTDWEFAHLPRPEPDIEPCQICRPETGLVDK